MGSALSVIRSLLENQIDVGTTTTSTDPTSTILNTYINTSIRKITRKDRPRELYSPTVTTADITINTNTVSMPATMFIPDLVYYQQSSGTTIELRQKPIKQMIDIETANNFFDTTNTGNPNFYDVKGTALIFNKYFSRTATAAIKIYGMGYPTTLSDDSDTTELPEDYDLLVAYESAVLFYEKDDDFDNQRKFELLAQQERADLRTFLRTDDSSIIQMDPYTFSGTANSSKTDPNIFFGGA
jgi:hypothetical protein